MNHWITLTADMLPEVIDQAELDAITAADTDGSVVDGIIQDVTASVREAIAANPANVMDLTGTPSPHPQAGGSGHDCLAAAQAVCRGSQ
ncbi:hypothetical protein M5E88_10730 [Akkermansia muciniphila]|nr:hypothetical protein M5E88_10730 [Akkermansia muciniphila]